MTTIAHLYFVDIRHTTDKTSQLIIIDQQSVLLSFANLLHLNVHDGASQQIFLICSEHDFPKKKNN